MDEIQAKTLEDFFNPTKVWRRLTQPEAETSGWQGSSQSEWGIAPHLGKQNILLLIWLDT